MPERLTPEVEAWIRSDEIHTRKDLLAHRSVLLAEIDALRKDLAEYTTHDHAPCIFCDPLRSQLATMSQRLQDAEARAKQAIVALQVYYRAATGRQSYSLEEYAAAQQIADELLAAEISEATQVVYRVECGLECEKRRAELGKKLTRAKAALREITGETYALGATMAAQIAKATLQKLERE